MNISVKFFASAREAVGESDVSLELHERATVNDMLDFFSARFDAMKQIRPYIRVAVNQSYVLNDHTLHNGDEVAIIPPVSGG